MEDFRLQTKVEILEDPSMPLESARLLYNKLKKELHEYGLVLRYILGAKASMKNGSSENEILTPIENGGREFWVQAKVSSKQEINISIGCGLYLSMSPEEGERWLVRQNSEISDKLKSIESSYPELLEDGAE